jgi:hypothetical protein
MREQGLVAFGDDGDAAMTMAGRHPLFAGVEFLPARVTSQA